jgi:hypothetical protein
MKSTVVLGQIPVKAQSLALLGARYLKSILEKQLEYKQDSTTVLAVSIWCSQQQRMQR